MANIKYKIYNVIALLIFTYSLNNCTTPISSIETSTLKNYEYFKSLLSSVLESISDRKFSLYNKEIKWAEGITLINTSFDLELVDYYGNRDFLQGKQAITSRKDLYTFLKIVHNYKFNYKYILIDISLDSKGIAYDDSLSVLIPKMSNIVIAKTKKVGIMTALESKSGFVDYFKMPYETGFVKYIFGTQDEPSLALRIYNERNRRNAIKSIGGILYFDGWKLCQNVGTIDYKVRFIETEDDLSDSLRTGNIYAYQNLGTDFYKEDSTLGDNRVNKVEKVKRCCENKIVVIGQFFGDDDKHDTYVGEMPGALINLNAYLYLQDGKHIVKIHYFLLLFVFYLSLYVFIEKKQKLCTSLKGKFSILHSDFIRILLTLVGWGFFFNIVALILYIIFEVYFNPWYPTIWFTFIPKCVKLTQSIIQKENEK